MLLRTPTITREVITRKGQQIERFLVYGGTDVMGRPVRAYRFSVPEAAILAADLGQRANCLYGIAESLSKKEALDAAEAIDILNVTGAKASLAQCARFFVEKNLSEFYDGNTILTDAIEKYIPSLGGTLHSHKVRVALGKLAAMIGKGKKTCDVTKDAVIKFLSTMNSPKTKNLNRAYVLAFLNWTKKNKLCHPDTYDNVRNIDKLKQAYKAPPFFHADQVEKIMRYFESLDDADMVVPKFAIGFFAGIRSDEIKRMDWSSISFENMDIRVEQPKGVSGTPPRVVSMSDNLYAWLWKYRKESGPVCVYSDFTFTSRKRDVEKAVGVDVTNKEYRNVARHTFATMHCAHHKNFELTASEMGHGSKTEMLMKHYKSITTNKDAEAFWNIYPIEGK